MTITSPVNVSLTVASTDALKDEAKIVMKATRPTPIISADAVAAVRFGFRLAFSLASPPVMPRSRANGQLMTRLSGRETVRPSTVTAKAIRAPRPTTGSALSTLPNSPYSSAPTPARRMTSPTITRCFEP